MISKRMSFKLVLFCLVICIQVAVYSQTPQGFNYQAVVRDGSGSLIANRSVSLRITLQSTTATPYYTESKTLTTTGQGVVNYTVGSGTVSYGTFAGIPWSSGDIYIKVEVDPNGASAYTQLGDPTKLQSVPYALYANGLQGPAGNNGVSIQWLGTLASDPASPTLNQAYYNSSDKKSYVFNGSSWNILSQDGTNGASGTGTSGQLALWSGTNSLQGISNLAWGSSSLQVTSPTTAGTDDPILEVKNKDGKVVFGVYQGGVRIYVEDSPIVKGAKGGFAIGGLTNQAKGGPAEYMRITSDSARIYINETTTKGAKGGFAIGGLTNQAKTITSRNIMYVAPDSTRIYVNENPTKGAKGGFAIGGLTNQAKGGSDQFLNLTTNNYLIGHQAGKNMTNGNFNSFIGYQSGFSNTSGNKNYFIGYRSGYNNINGYSNIFIGDSAGFTNSSGYFNVFIGNQSGLSNTTGNRNTANGSGALRANTTGYSNSAFGEWALYSNTNGIFNTAIGRLSLFQNTLGSSNTAVGTGTLMSNTNGIYNTAIGGVCLSSLAFGNGNTAVGTLALQYVTSGINNTALGYNSFQTNIAIVNSMALGANAQVLASNQIVLGDGNIALIGGMVGWSTLSDGRFKSITKDEVKGLDFITKLKPVIYTFDAKKFDEFSLKNLPNEKRSEIMGSKDYSKSTAIKRSGFVAQDVEKAAEASGFVFNGVHHPSNEIDNYSIDYSLLTVPLVKAVQELNAKNEELQKQIDTLKAELEEIKAMLKK